MVTPEHSQSIPPRLEKTSPARIKNSPSLLALHEPLSLQRYLEPASFLNKPSQQTPLELPAEDPRPIVTASKIPPLNLPIRPGTPKGLVFSVCVPQDLAPGETAF